MRYFFSIALIFCFKGLFAQHVMDKPISIEIMGQSIDEALLAISEKADVNIFFSPKVFEKPKKVNFNSENQSLKFVLKKCLEGTRVGFKLSDGSIILFRKALPIYNLSGYLSDAQTGERLIGANIIDLNNLSGGASNAFGFYSLNFKEGPVQLQVSYLGYQSKLVNFDLSKSKTFNIKLEPAITLQEVIVKPKEDSLLMGSEPNETTLPLNWLSQLPTVGGESDVIRYLHLLPGVNGGTDGFGGLHIRGGNSDQNLILLDDVPVYNPSHTFGFYSIFNPDLTKSVKLYKGGFPARYEGRISSVLDVRTKEGNSEKLSGSVTVGTTATRGLLEIPIAKGKGGILLAGRRTHINTWLKPISRRIKNENELEGEMAYNFYDFNLKAHYSFSPKDKVYLSYYSGEDEFTDFTSSLLDDEFEVLEEEENDEVIINFFESGFSTNWGNEITSLRWNHLFSNKLFSNTTATYSKYEYESNSATELQFSIFGEDFIASKGIESYNSEIKEVSLRNDFEYFIDNNLELRFGVNLSHRTFNPGFFSSEQFDQNLDSIIIDGFSTGFSEADLIKTINLHGYVEPSFTYNNFHIISGLHFSSFFQAGKSRRFIQPRLRVNYSFTKKMKAHIAATRSVQHLNLLTRSDAGLPNDLWVPSGLKIPAQDAWQFTAGFSGELTPGQCFKISGFYKDMKNLKRLNDTLVDPSQNPMLNVQLDGSNWENSVEVGSGKSYGVEVSLEQQRGKFTGWISYTLSKSDRTFNQQTIPSFYDSRHNFSLAAAYRFNDWLDCSANWLYQTGRPLSSNSIQEQDLPFSSILNSKTLKEGATQLPANHRIDVGINAHFKGGLFDHKIHLSVYNVYNRKNILYAKPVSSESNSTLGVQGLSVIPSLSYSISW